MRILIGLGSGLLYNKNAPAGGKSRPEGKYFSKKFRPQRRLDFIGAPAYNDGNICELWRLTMKLRVVQKQNNSDMCVVCGVDNRLSLGAKFYAVEGGLMVGVVTGRDEHQSYPNRMHGGMISALLDEVVGRAINVVEPEAFGVTSELNVKFKKPVPLNEEIKAVGRLTKNTRLVFHAEGFIEDREGNILATAAATYIKMTADKIAGKPLSPEQYFLIPDDTEEIEVRNHDYFD